MTRLTLIALVSAALNANCNSVDSDNILTSGMYADIRATSYGTGVTTVRTTLYLERPSSLDFIELEGDDLLIAYAPDGDSQVMRESQFLGITNYTADFDIDDSGSEFIVELSRTVDGGAPESRVYLAEQFDLLPPESATYSRAEDDIVIDWAPADSGDDVDLEISGSCIETELVAVDGDPGTYQIPAGTLIQPQGQNVPEACDITVTVTKSAPGELDPSYGFGGQIYGEQVRSVQMSSTL